MKIRSDDITFPAITLFCLAVTILDFFGILDTIDWLPKKVPSILLIFLPILTAYIINRIEHISDIVTTSESNIVSSLNGGGIQVFKDPETMYKYLIGKYSSVKSSIDITNFGDYYMRDKNDEFNKKFLDVISSGTINVRQIVLVRNQDSVSQIEEMLKEFHDKTNFRLGCYSYNPSQLNLISLMIIDNEEVLLTYREDKFEFRRQTLSIENPAFTSFYRGYFDTLWRESIIIKNKGVDYTAFAELTKAVNKNLSSS
jgi:hypothetical protein